MNPISKVKDFMLAAGKLSPAEENRADEIDLAANLIEEEFIEWQNETPDNPKDFKEALDLLYVVCQYLNTVYGPEKSELGFTALHENNMSKTHGGAILFRDDGKVMKPRGYKPLDLTELYEV